MATADLGRWETAGPSAFADLSGANSTHATNMSGAIEHSNQVGSIGWSSAAPLAAADTAGGLRESLPIAVCDRMISFELVGAGRKGPMGRRESLRWARLASTVGVSRTLSY
jgi:hypothetical protein